MVFRPHPENRYDADALAALQARGVIIDRGAPLHALLELAAAVVTINSTTGLEALMYSRPRLVLGNAIYGGKGFSLDVRGADEIAAALAGVRAGAGWSPRHERRYLSFLNELTHRYLLFSGAEPAPGINQATLRRALAHHGLVPEGPRAPAAAAPPPPENDVASSSGASASSACRQASAR